MISRQPAFAPGYGGQEMPLPRGDFNFFGGRMKPVEDTYMAAKPEGCGGGITATAREVFVTGVYCAVDAAADRELVRLKHAEGIVPSCRQGCCNCCRGQHIQTNIVEAHALGQYIKRNFSRRQIIDLRQRTLAWHAREAFRRGQPGMALTPPADDFESTLCCPLLVDRACSAYPVRPVICRTHFVSSDPCACRPPAEHHPADPVPHVLTSVIAASADGAMALRAAIEKTGRDYSRTIKLLPHWLAIEMGWGSEIEF
jgi:Fe-S-cluster containining protein